jgi:hypothetical protein
VVPPFIRTEGRRWWGRTKTGMRNGGLSPHQPRPVASEDDPLAQSHGGRDDVEMMIEAGDSWPPVVVVASTTAQTTKPRIGAARAGPGVGCIS